MNEEKTPEIKDIVKHSIKGTIKEFKLIAPFACGILCGTILTNQFGIHSESGGMKSVEDSDTLSYLQEHASDISLSDDISYFLAAYYNGSTNEFLIQNGETNNNNCAGTHKYYYRYLVDAEKFEPVGFTCNSDISTHESINQALIEEQQLFTYGTYSKEEILQGIADQESKNEELEEIRKEQMKQAEFSLLNQNERLLSIVEVRPLNGGEPFYVVGYEKSSTIQEHVFYDILEMKDKTFSLDDFEIGIGYVLDWVPDIYSNSVTYEQIIAIKEEIEKQENLLPSSKVFTL